MSFPPVKAAPTKGLFLEALTRDLELEDAIHDLVDNSIDAAKRMIGRGPFNGLWVKINFDKHRFVSNSVTLSLDSVIFELTQLL